MLKPAFERGSILKQNMLESLRDYPRKAFNLLYSSLGNGIVNGFDVAVIDDEKFSISPGIVKINGLLLFSDEQKVVEQLDGENYVYIEVKCNNTVDGDMYIVEIKQYQSQQLDEIELFRYTKNAKISMLQNCNELFAPPINRVNKLFSNYSYIGGESLCQDYFKLYAKEVLNASDAKIKDVAFAYECLNGINDVDLIKSYFDNDGTNLCVLEAMKKRLAEINMREGESTQITTEKPKKKVIISVS